MWNRASITKYLLPPGKKTAYDEILKSINMRLNNFNRPWNFTSFRSRNNFSKSDEIKKKAELRKIRVFFYQQRGEKAKKN